MKAKNERMTAIFLDVDSVLKDEETNEIDEEKLERLAKVCETVDAKIVLYTNYKYAFNNEFRPKNEKAKKLADGFHRHNLSLYRTPNFLTEEDVKHHRTNLIRPNEVIRFLVDYNVDKFSILSADKIRDRDLAKNQIIVSNGLDGDEINNLVAMLTTTKY